MTALTNLTSDWLCSVTKRRKMAATRVKRFDLLEAVTVQVNSTHSSHLRWQWCWSWSRCKWWQIEKLCILLVSFLGRLWWTTCYWAILQLNRKDLFSVHYQMIFVFNQFHICKVQRNENCRCKFALLIFSTRNEYQETWAAAYFALSPAQYHNTIVVVWCPGQDFSLTVRSFRVRKAPWLTEMHRSFSEASLLHRPSF